MQHLFTALYSLFFPSRCIGCKAPGSALCTRCAAGIAPAPSTERENVFAVYDYRNPLVEKAIKDCKYYRRTEAALVLAHCAASYISEYLSEKLQSERSQAFVLVPIPQHQHKTAARGFNQSESIARAIATSLEGARIENMLRKIRPTTPQAHVKNKSARLENVQGSMEAKYALDPDMLYILVDDVTTTGATFMEAKRALRAKGAKNILAIALTHGAPHK